MTVKEKGHPETRKHVVPSVSSLANAVSITLGPKGRHVVIEESEGPSDSDRGVENMWWSSWWCSHGPSQERGGENLSGHMVREVVTAAANLPAGATATLLAHAIYHEGARLVAAGHNPLKLKLGIDKAVEHVVESLRLMAKPTGGPKDIAQVGAISAHGDKEIGDNLSEAIEKVGKEGVITIDESETGETTLEIASGIQLNSGYLSPYFVTDSERMEVVLENTYILISEKKISRIDPLLPSLEELARQKKSLLIIAEDIDGEALATMVVNKLRGHEGSRLRRLSRRDAARLRDPHWGAGDQ